MEVIDLRMLTSAWGKYYNDARKGSWMPLIAAWTAVDGYVEGNDSVHIEGVPYSPGPIVGIVRDKMRDAGLVVRVFYKTARISTWRSATYGGRKYDYPVYEGYEEKETDVVIEPFTPINAIFRIAEDDNLVYDVTNVVKLPYYAFEDDFSGDLSGWDATANATITDDDVCILTASGYLQIDTRPTNPEIDPLMLKVDISVGSGSDIRIIHAAGNGAIVKFAGNVIYAYDQDTLSYNAIGTYLDDTTYSMMISFCGDYCHYGVYQDAVQIGGNYSCSTESTDNVYKIECVGGTCTLDDFELVAGCQYCDYDDVRYSESIAIRCLASPTPRYLYAMKYWELYENLVKIKDAIWASPYFCATCTGTGIYPPINSIIDTHLGSTCPECDGFRFSGPHAVDFMLDRKAKDVGLSRYDGESDEQLGKRIWARKWRVIPTEDEIVRYFNHFAHATEDDCAKVAKIEDEDEPVFYVSLDQEKMGSKALWAPGDTDENWDGLVERICPAGVNGYFGGWRLSFHDEILAEDFIDGSTEQYWMYMIDVYNPMWEGAVFRESLFGGFDSAMTLTLFWDDFSGGTFAKWTNTVGSPSISGGKALIPAGSEISWFNTYAYTANQVKFEITKAHGGTGGFYLRGPSNSALVLFETDGNIYINGTLAGAYPNGIAADIVVDIIHLDDVARVLVDGVQVGDYESINNMSGAGSWKFSAVSGCPTATIDDVYINRVAF